MLPEKTPTFDGEVRHRTRRHPIWMEKPTSDPIVQALLRSGGELQGEPVLEPRPLGMSEKEYAVQVTFAPVRALIGPLSGDHPVGRHFLEEVRKLRADLDNPAIEQRIDTATANYVPYRRGAPWEAMRRVVECCVFDESDPKQSVYSLAASGCAVDAGVDVDDPQQWTHAKRFPEAAAMLAAFGAGRCMRIVTEQNRKKGLTTVRVCAEVIDGDSRRRYCRLHDGRSRDFTESQARGDREAISALLTGVARALCG